MKQNNKIKQILLAGLLTCPGSAVLADITVDKTNGILSISSDIEGTVVAKVIAPNDEVVVNERYSGNSFNWSPSSGPDGAYRYDVRVMANAQTSNNKEGRRLVLFNVANESTKNVTDVATNSDYAGGSVEVINGQINGPEEAMQ